LADEKGKVDLTSGVELLRRGATLLQEPCPRCGGLQVKYRGRTVCLQCGSLEEVAKVEEVDPQDVMVRLRDLAARKVGELIGQLEGEKDLERQASLVGLLLRYMELLERVGVKKG
jgi:UPF0148 protein